MGTEFEIIDDSRRHRHEVHGLLLGLRVGWGGALLTAPRPLLRRLAGASEPADRAAVIVLRVLGTRHLAQAALEAFGPQPLLRYMGIAVDGLHALTAVGLAVLDRRWRRGALTDTAIAVLFATATAAVVRNRKESAP